MIKRKKVNKEADKKLEKKLEEKLLLEKKDPQERFDVFVKNLPEDKADEMIAIYITPTDIQRSGAGTFMRKQMKQVLDPV